MSEMPYPQWWRRCQTRSFDTQQRGVTAASPAGCTDAPPSCSMTRAKIKDGKKCAAAERKLHHANVSSLACARWECLQRLSFNFTHLFITITIAITSCNYLQVVHQRHHFFFWDFGPPGGVGRRYAISLREVISWLWRRFICHPTIVHIHHEIFEMHRINKYGETSISRGLRISNLYRNVTMRVSAASSTSLPDPLLADRATQPPALK